MSVVVDFVFFAIDTELENSLTMSATRAALYTIKTTAEIIFAKGIFLIFLEVESAEFMTKNVADLTHLLDILVNDSKTKLSTEDYVSTMIDIFADLRLKVVNSNL